jgi:hypothetical protein
MLLTHFDNGDSLRWYLPAWHRSVSPEWKRAQEERENR